MRLLLAASALLSTVCAQDVPGSDLAGAQVGGEQHWAYEPPRRPDVGDGSRHPIDVLLQARMLPGLELAPVADKTTLIRRVSLDLIGLPPTLAEVDAFLADEEPGAYERLIDRLLASPRYGEHWAVPWLDLARYADTNGYNLDQPRSMWPWRDWVIDAFNRDMPFDRFTIEQLAGDLLPDADEGTRVATGFHCNTMFNNEGGVDAKEARWERLLDRANTTATVWLGSTFGCARCHDHKYDPISQREYYGLVAFFESQKSVVLEVPSEEQKVERRRLQDKAEELTQSGADAAAIKAARQQANRAPRHRTKVLRENRDAKAETHMRQRGGFDDPGELVAAHTPEVLHPWPEGVARDRLGLARWLIDERNPLVARVHANRIWGMLFGEPLVATPEDFGLQAEEPMHLDVLDWLATECIRLGWSQKQLIRTMVSSDTYRRSAHVSPAQRRLDPSNDYYARGNRFRLQAEQIRDLMLSVSGLLSTKMGGPSVFPLQADTSGAIALNKVDMRWRISPGEDRHRRGVYTYWRRTAPFLQLVVFDAPTREECVVRRERTNTPLQALSGLNDPASWAAAEALGKRMRELSGTDRDRLAHGFRLCTARAPSEQELDRLESALRREAPAVAWSLLANVLLNLDETLTRG